MKALAKDTLAQLLQAGFDDARVTITESDSHELNVAHNHASLMRSTSNQTMALLGIKDQRKVTASVSNLTDGAISDVIANMIRDVATAPQDEANAVAPEQTGEFSKGPTTVDREAMAASVQNFLALRSERYPTFQIEEAAIKHSLDTTVLVTSKNTELKSSIGSYDVSLMGSSKDEHGTSSFNYTGGSMDALPEQLIEHFELENLIENSVQETQNRLLGEKFVGDVILTPMAVMDLLEWLLDQVSDYSLISGTSVYQNSVGSNIASSLLTVRQHLQGSGVNPFNGEGFVAEPITLVENGKLTSLLPSYYGSRKLDLPHTPVSSAWAIEGGDISRTEMVAGVKKGALVGRLSMGSPAANGDFSGVIKNSFLLENGERSTALSETMITGNVAQMLQDIVAISRDVTDYGSHQLPWLKVQGLKFS
jgi:PmbA protein